MRKLVRGLLALLVASTALVVTAEPASAVWQCRAWTEWPAYGRATCDFGLGGVRARVDCWWPNGDVDTFFGPWVSARQVSSVICTGGSYVLRANYETF